MKFGEAMRLAENSEWIKPRYYSYLKGERNVLAEQQSMQALLAVPQRDRTKSWAASGAGKCLRQRQFSWLGLPQKPSDEHSLNIFLNGNWVHMRHQSIGVAAGYLAVVEAPVNNTEYNLRGTMDALDSSGTPVEYKSINANGFAVVRSFGAKDEHIAQVHSYMLAGGYDLFRVVYENKNTNALLEFHVKRDPAVITEVANDLDALNTATSSQQLLPMLAECTRKEGQYRWCPYASQCPTASRELSWKEIPVRSATPATSSSASVLPMSPSQLASLRITKRSSQSSGTTGTSSSAE